MEETASLEVWAWMLPSLCLHHKTQGHFLTDTELSRILEVPYLVAKVFFEHIFFALVVPERQLGS